MRVSRALPPAGIRSTWYVLLVLLVAGLPCACAGPAGAYGEPIKTKSLEDCPEIVVPGFLRMVVDDVQHLPGDPNNKVVSVQLKLYPEADLVFGSADANVGVALAQGSEHMLKMERVGVWTLEALLDGADVSALIHLRKWRAFMDGAIAIESVERDTAIKVTVPVYDWATSFPLWLDV